jgi:hypothetical protein
LGKDAAAPGAQDPPVAVPFGVDPDRKLAGRTVGENPIMPVPILHRKPSSELNGINTESLKHILVHDRHLLDGIVYADGPLGELQAFPKMPVGHGGDPGGAVAGKINSNSVWFAMIERCDDAFAWCHGGFPGIGESASI